jgi:hypothetical protein
VKEEIGKGFELAKESGIFSAQLKIKIINQKTNDCNYTQF